MTLKELAGRGWIPAEPPMIDHEPSVVAMVDGQPIRAGFERKNSPIVNTRTEIHRKFRTGQYDLDVRIETPDGEIVAAGYIKVERADGYER